MKARKALSGLCSEERALLAAAFARRFSPPALRPAPVLKNRISRASRRLRGGPFVNGSWAEEESKSCGSIMD